MAMWDAAETVPSIKERTEFHKYRIREELYNVRQDPHSYINVAMAPENRERIAEMQAILVNWMEETDHPALDLMKDPHNEKLIAEYMQWERENAVKQVENREATMLQGEIDAFLLNDSHCAQRRRHLKSGLKATPKQSSRPPWPRTSTSWSNGAA